MLAAPPSGSYDLRFRLLDVPVRVNPLFWLVMLVISGQAQGGNTKLAFVFMGCAFVSILVHEFGHALSSRALGREPLEIVLYGMGGLCYNDSAGQAPWHRFLVSAAGPAAGFGLLALVLGFLKVSYGIQPGDAIALLGFGGGDPLAAILKLPDAILARYAIVFFIEINLLWGVLNLLPIWPLDGGQMTGVALTHLNPANGMRWTQTVSLLTAGGIALWAASRQNWYTAAMFGFFALHNYWQLEEIHRSSRYGEEHRWRG